MSFVPPQNLKSLMEEPSFELKVERLLINKLTTEIGIEHIKTSTKIISIKEENKN
jgi:monoamine oxidase